MTPAQVMNMAAAMLREDAIAGRESCMVGEKQWACPDCKRDRLGYCESQRASEGRAKIAASLIAMAEAM